MRELLGERKHTEVEKMVVVRHRRDKENDDNCGDDCEYQ